MKNWLVLALGMFFCTIGFGQDPSSAQNPSSTTATPDAGVSFNLPAGSWQPIPENQSLVPYMENKILEQIETTRKISVVYQTSGAYTDVPSLFDQSMSIFSLHWDALSTVQPIKLISPQSAVGGPRKFSAVYRIVDALTSTPFRLEIIVVSPHDMRGNKGVLFILCPEHSYYDDRFVIAEIRNALVLDVNAAVSQPKSPDTTANTPADKKPAA